MKKSFLKLVKKVTESSPCSSTVEEEEITSLVQQETGLG
jgi:hypothetical protein